MSLHDGLILGVKFVVTALIAATIIHRPKKVGSTEIYSAGDAVLATVLDMAIVWWLWS